MPAPPDLDRHVAELDLDKVWEYLNPQMIYGKHLGLKGSVKRLREEGDPKLAKLEAVIDELKDARPAAARMKARAVWRFFPAEADGNRVTLRDPETGEAVAAWDFPRQNREGGLCLADYVLPGDHVALFVTTRGRRSARAGGGLEAPGRVPEEPRLRGPGPGDRRGRRRVAPRLPAQALGLPRRPRDLPLEDKLAARYRGKRYSFGYPACPDLAFQRELFHGPAARGDRRPPHRRRHDGPRGERLGAGVPPSGRAVFRGVDPCE